MKAISVMILTAMAVFLLAARAPAIERTLAGRMESLNCVFIPDLCPVDKRDPHIALELDFVLLLEKGDHYLLTNVPREVKINLFGKEIKVTGDVREEYRSITVETLKVKENGQYIKAWSPLMESRDWQEWLRRFYEKGSDN